MSLIKVYGDHRKMWIFNTSERWGISYELWLPQVRNTQIVKFSTLKHLKRVRPQWAITTISELPDHLTFPVDKCL